MPHPVKVDWRGENEGPRLMVEAVIEVAHRIGGDRTQELGWRGKHEIEA